MPQQHNVAALKDCVLLHVEDDDATAYLFQTALQENGVSINLYRVGDVTSALSFLRQSPPYDNAPRPDLVVLDINLPKATGFEFLGEIRRDEKLRNLKVVVFTSSELPADEHDAFSAGADGYFTKSPYLDGFIATVRSICEQIPVGPVLRS